MPRLSRSTARLGAMFWRGWCAAECVAGSWIHIGVRAGLGKHGLAVGFLRRSGVQERSIQPWVPVSGEQATAADLFETFVHRSGRGTLSPRLVNDLERDAEEFGAGGLPESLYKAELARLVERHGGGTADADALLHLGQGECVPPETPAPSGRRTPERAARVAVFLRQECQPHHPVDVAGG